MNRLSLSSHKILLLLIVCALALISCNASSALAQLAPTQVPTLESDIASPEPSATALLTRSTATIQSITSVAPSATRTTIVPSAPVVAQPALASRTLTPSPKITSTPTRLASATTAPNATRTSTLKAQTGCVANSPQGKPSGIISSVTLGTKTSPTAALAPAAVFANNATIYAVVATQNAPATAIIKAEWYVTNVGSAAPCNTFIDRAELSADTRIDFILTPSSQWLPGTYRVEIYVNGTLDRVTGYSVK